MGRPGDESLSVHLSPPSPFVNTVLDETGLPARLPQSKERLRLQFYAALMLVDAGCLLFGFLTGNILRFGDPFAAMGMRMMLLLVPIYLVIALNSRAYALEVLFDARRGTKRAVLSLAVSCAAILLVGFYAKHSEDFSRLIFGVGAVGGMIALVFTRRASARTARRLFGSSPMTEVVIRDGVQIAAADDAFLIDAAAAGFAPSADDPVLLDKLGRYLKNADRVVVACPPERRAAWAMMLKGADVKGEVLLPELDHLGTLGLGSFRGGRTMLVSVGPLTLEERAMKRTLDLVVLLVAAPLILPVMLLVGIAVRLDSPGPAFFRQHRIGRGNRLFGMIKFRSMRVESGDAAGTRSTGREDDRITRVGRFIRRTSLDELPQVLNVLLGEMSIVGPRPHAVASTADNALFWEVDERYWHRHAMKPGMTGLAQVRGFRGATNSRADLTNRLQADLEYLNGWTIWRDVGILFATVGVLTHRNAY